MIMANVKEIMSQKDLDTFLQSNANVVVDFHADWCGPCKVFGPHFKKMAEEITNWAFASVNVEDASDVASSFQIRSIPTIILFQNGKKIDTVVGGDVAKLKSLLV
jgi:thioredoxin 1